MDGPYMLNNTVIDIIVSDLFQYGVYAITDIDDNIVYVGRSDKNLKRRIKDHVGEKYYYYSFYFEEATSEKDAYEKECRLWHKYKPRDNDIHPDLPDYSKHWKCPIDDCPKHY